MTHIIYRKDLKKIFDEPKNFMISGKDEDNAACIEALLESISEKTPDEVKFVLIDTRNTFKKYENDPHLFLPRITDAHEGVKTLELLVSEMEKRYQMLEKNHVSDIAEYNQEADTSSEMPFINIIATNLDDIIALDDESAEISIASIAQRGKSCGIHVFVALRNIRSGRNNLGRIRANIDVTIVTPRLDDEDNFKFFKIHLDARSCLYALFESPSYLAIVQEKLGIEPLFNEMVDFIFANAHEMLMEKFNIDYHRAANALKIMKETVKNNSPFPS